MYTKELYPDLFSAAFVLECSKFRGKNFGSFPEQSIAAGAYRGDILGLMAIHLILLTMKKVNPTLQVRLQIYSDCLGALGTVATDSLSMQAPIHPQENDGKMSRP